MTRSIYTSANEANESLEWAMVEALQDQPTTTEGRLRLWRDEMTPFGGGGAAGLTDALWSKKNEKTENDEKSRSARLASDSDVSEAFERSKL